MIVPTFVTSGGRRRVAVIRAAALTLTATLTVAACALTATRPPDNNGDTPDTTTTTVTVPLDPLPDQTLSAATVAAPADRHEAIQIAEPPAAPPTTVALPPHYNIWLMLALCESGGDWYINTGNSFYGGLQFTLASWRGAGGEQWAPRPHLASVLGQMWTAETLLDMQGWGAWPACARRLGLR